jgi:flagellar biosynthesis regulator FlbT
MAMNMTLGPQEWLMVGGTRIVNIRDEPVRFHIDGAGPILRQAHTLSETTNSSPAERVYLSVQKVYLGVQTASDVYCSLVQDLLAERPESRDVVRAANQQISKGSLYGALREYRKLISL